MRVISNKALVDFGTAHPHASAPLQSWRRSLASSYVENFASLKQLSTSADKVGDFVVFDIGGNKFRLVAAVHFNRQTVFVRHVFTHAEYDEWEARS